MSRFLALQRYLPWIYLPIGVVFFLQWMFFEHSISRLLFSLLLIAVGLWRIIARRATVTTPSKPS